jgi:hypothetical protein
LLRSLGPALTDIRLSQPEQQPSHGAAAGLHQSKEQQRRCHRERDPVVSEPARSDPVNVAVGCLEEHSNQRLDDIRRRSTAVRRGRTGIVAEALTLASARIVKSDCVACIPSLASLTFSLLLKWSEDGVTNHNDAGREEGPVSSELRPRASVRRDRTRFRCGRATE